MPTHLCSASHVQSSRSPKTHPHRVHGLHFLSTLGLYMNLVSPAFALLLAPRSLLRPTGHTYSRSERGWVRNRKHPYQKQGGKDRLKQKEKIEILLPFGGSFTLLSVLERISALHLYSPSGSSSRKKLKNTRTTRQTYKECMTQSLSKSSISFRLLEFNCSPIIQL